jgi:hypothetical protein
MSARDRTVLAAMAREEFRLHSRLFGGRRFAFFPLLVAAATAFAVWALDAVGTPPSATLAGVHALVVLFGLQTGSVGLVGSDAMRGVLGDLTLLVFSSRTLPLSPRRLLALFVLKDAAYYAALFLLPLSVAFLPVAGVRLPLLWLSLLGCFALGLAVTFAGIALSTRGVPGTLVAAAALLGGGLVWRAGVDPLSLTPYAVYRDPLSAASLAGLLAVPALATVAVLAYDPTYRRPARTAADRFGALLDRTGDPLLAKSLLDVARSSGGLWKVLFSGGVVFAVVAFLLSAAADVTGRPPATGVSFGALLALTAFTTYNWLTMADDVEFYQQYPIPIAAVFRAKFRAFLLVGLPAALAYYALALALFGTAPLDSLAGLALLGGLSLYLFGVTVFLTGFSPNEFLFDSVLFAGFGVAVAVPLVPVLVAGFALPVDRALLAALALAGVCLGAAGLFLYRRAVPRWTERYRA